MDNQHRLIKGFRELTQDEVDLINHVKRNDEMIGALVEMLEARAASVDQRWVAIGKTHLQQGVMALVRAIARPDWF